MYHKKIDRCHSYNLLLFFNSLNMQIMKAFVFSVSCLENLHAVIFSNIYGMCANPRVIFNSKNVI